MKQSNTSWGKSANWYNTLLSDNDSYQNKVILPNLIRLMDVKRDQPSLSGASAWQNDKILDVGCGTGFFAAEFVKLGGKVTGVDIGEQLLEIARKNMPKTARPHPALSLKERERRLEFILASAEALPFEKESFDKVVFVLSLQNMSDMGKVIAEAARVLKPGGKIFLVLNHPAFRIPGESSWGWDAEKKIQYRRIDSYLSEKKLKIQMHPGKNPDEVTYSFHASLQYYFKIFSKNGLLVERLEEWTSHTRTPTGPRAEAENRARAEFPLFLALVTCLPVRQVDKI